MPSIASVAERCLERSAAQARRFSVAIYLLLGALALMQLENAGALERIAQQTVGRWLLVAVSLSLLALGLLVAVDVVLARARGLLAPGAIDALLHCSLAVVGMRLSFGAGLVPEATANLVLSGLGLLDVSAGACLFFVAAVGGDGDHQRVDAALGRDHRVRGGLIAILGSLVLASGVERTAELGLEQSLGALGLPALGLATAAFGAYALHGLWSIREEGRLALL